MLATDWDGKCFTSHHNLLLIDVLHRFVFQTRRSIPIHFKVRRPQNVEEKETDEEDEGQLRDAGASRRTGTGGHFEGGMGGRARGGQWQVELPPSARDPRDAARASSQAAAEPASFVTAGRAFEDSLEEYPALARAGGGAMAIGGWGKINNNNGKMPDFPALGPGPGAGLRGGAVGGGGSNGRSFSGAATGSFIRDGKVGGGGVQPAGDDSWAISTKKEKRLKPSGGISKPDTSNGWTKQEDETPVNLKGSDYPQLSLGPKGYRYDIESRLCFANETLNMATEKSPKSEIESLKSHCPNTPYAMCDSSAVCHAMLTGRRLR